MVLALIRKDDGQGADRVAFGFADVSVFLHLTQDVVASLQRLLGIDGGVVSGRLVDNTYEAGALLEQQIAGLLVEIRARSSIYTVRVAAEEDGVQVHGDYFVLGVVALQLDCRDPLFELVLYEFEVFRPGDAGSSFVTREQRLGELLGDGTAAALAGIAHHDGLDGHAGKRAEIYAGMLVESGIFGGDRRIHEGFRQFLEGYVRTVFNVVCIEHLPVTADKLCSEIGLRVLQLFKRRNLCKSSHQKQAQSQYCKRRHEQDPPPFDYFFLGLKLHFQIGLKCEFSN